MTRMRTITAAAIVALVSAACGGPSPDAAPSEPDPVTITEPGVAREAATTTTSNPPTTSTTMPDVDDQASGVVLATVLVLGGADVELAIAEGLITADDLERALEAIADRSLDDVIGS